MNDRSPGSIRNRREQRRARIPELQRLVDDVGPSMWERVASDRRKKVPEAWSDLVAQMRAEVHADADKDGEHDPEATLNDRRGHHWWSQVGRVDDMLRHLTSVILDDLGFGDEATLASILLLHRAAECLQIELQDGSRSEGRHDHLEYRCRIQRALRALTPVFDGPTMKRLRVIQAAESAARFTELPSEEEIQGRLQRIAEREGDDYAERSREWIEVKQPAINGLLARSRLAEIDKRFGSLDPLVVMEEFADANSKAAGGRSTGGDGRTGPARAAARLCLLCGALDTKQRDGESFDDATDRIRSSLLAARSRLRKEVRSFPTGFPE